MLLLIPRLIPRQNVYNSTEKKAIISRGTKNTSPEVYSPEVYRVLQIRVYAWGSRIP